MGKLKYTCWGAARQVTGSMHLFEMPSGYKVLVDCGIDYEVRDQRDVNAVFPFDPATVDIVILTHAHIDHSGNVPNLVGQGFKGNIFCTEPTAYLLEKLWADSVNIQNQERKKGSGQVKLYGFSEVKKSLDRILTLPFEKTFKISDELSFTFYEAGHILGAAAVQLNVSSGGKTKVIGITGDLGNYNSKLIVDPRPVPDVEALIIESTYGDRLHQVQKSAREELKEHVQKACVQRNGRLIIPAFSVGRTQAILFTLKQLFESGELPPIRVFADSPLAIASTNIHYRFRDYLNKEANDHFKETGSLFHFDNLQLIEDEEDVEEMEYYRDACILVSSAGMMEGGRIQQHLQDHIMDPMCTVLIAGFCSPGTTGAKLLNGVNPIRIKGKDRYVYASIMQTDVFSAHPDREGLMRYIDECNQSTLKDIYLVHGVEESINALQKNLQSRFKADIHVPVKGQEYLI